jgi:hypothetical protein
MWTTALRSERRLAVVAGVALSVVLAGGRARAQDTHYWSIQYGPVGQLVGGQLIGGVDDLSSTFYNPGALALRNESSYLLSTESVQWESVSTESLPSFAVFDASSSHFGTAPSLLAGVLPHWLGPDTHLAWSFLTRQHLDVRLGQRVDNSLPAPWVRSATEAYFDQDATESWAGLTASHRFSDSFGLGLTGYGIYRGQRLRHELSAQAIDSVGDTLLASGVRDFEYSHYRMLAKVGFAWQSPRWKAGFSVTTPSLAAFGSGKAAYTLSLTGVDLDRDGVTDYPTLTTGTEEDLDSHYRSSWAAGAGARRSLGATKLYASIEWFAPVETFTVMELPGARAESARLTQELTSVVNGGVGVEHVISPDLSVYGALHTDFSAATDGANGVAVSDWDIYHLSGGASFRIGDNRFTLGASWATGGKQRQLKPLVPPGVIPGSGLDAEVDIGYSKLTFLLGFVFGR